MSLNYRIKTRIRLATFPPLAQAAHALGFSWERIGDRLGPETRVGQLRHMGRPRRKRTPKQPLRIVFVTLMGGNSGLSSAEVVLGRALYSAGHDVQYILCDRQLPVCEVKSDQLSHSWDARCDRCYRRGSQLFRATGLPVRFASELLAGTPPHEGNWDEFVESGLLKHFRVGVLQESALVEERRRSFRSAARVSARIGMAVAAERPDRVVMSHGLYCTWGPARLMLQEAGIPVVVYGEAKRRDSLNINWNMSSDWWDVSEEWTRIRDVPLTPEQDAELDDYLGSRRDHSRDALRYNFGGEEPADVLRQRLRLDANRRTFVLFTNVLWDAASAQREIAFANPIEWVVETIRWFAQRPQLQLVVKIHPAEVVIGTRQPFAEVVREHFPQLPQNVRLIEPAEKINSWSVIQIADLCLAHTSTVGMEAPLAGVPCAVVSRTHFREKGFTIDVASREEYFRLIESFDGASLDRERLITLARRYAYLLFMRYQLDFPFRYQVRYGDVRAFRRMGEEELLAHPTIRLVIEAIERQEPFLRVGPSVVLRGTIEPAAQVG